jgi:hypothetical protein
MTQAGQVTKALKALGFPKAEWNKVGVSTYNEGFITSNNYGGSVCVTWELAGHYKQPTTAELQKINTAVRSLAMALAGVGFKVSLRGDLLKHLEVAK